jgi:MFS family permease
MGFAPSSAASVPVWTNVGGAIGGGIFGLLTQRFSVKALTIGTLVLSTVAVAIFGRTPADLQQMSIICAMAGFCANAGVVGLYAMIAQVFPTHVRAFGTGFASVWDAEVQCSPRSLPAFCSLPDSRCLPWL